MESPNLQRNPTTCPLLSQSQQTHRTVFCCVLKVIQDLFFNCTEAQKQGLVCLSQQTSLNSPFRSGSRTNEKQDKAQWMVSEFPTLNAKTGIHPKGKAAHGNHTGRRTRRATRRKQMGPVDVNGGVHTARSNIKGKTFEFARVSRPVWIGPYSQHNCVLKS